MSGFMGTLVAPKIRPLARNDDEEKKKMGGDEKNEDNAMLTRDELDLGPNFCLINQPNKDKGGKKILRRRKFILERLTIPISAGIASTPPHSDLQTKASRADDVQMVGISIVCPTRPEIVLSQPFTSSPKAYLFTLKEGTKYRLSFSFIVSNKLVSGLKYENTLWKAGIRVDKCTVMLGTYKPREKPYVFHLQEETLPCGMLVRGLYTAKTKVLDSEGKCYMDIHYYFNISKTWPAISS